MTPDPAYDAAFKRYMEALLDGDARVGKKLIEELLGQQIALNRLYSDYIERGMYEIGRLWENNQISIADEHLAASTTQLLLADLYLKVNGREKNGKRVVIACVPHDLHELGSLIISSVFQLAGWDISLLGADVPTRALIDYVTENKPNTLALSATLPANRQALENVLEIIVPNFPELEILVGGQALSGSEAADNYREALLARFPNARYLQSLEALENYLSPN